MNRLSQLGQKTTTAEEQRKQSRREAQAQKGCIGSRSISLPPNGYTKVPGAWNLAPYWNAVIPNGEGDIKHVAGSTSGANLFLNSLKTVVVHKVPSRPRIVIKAPTSIPTSQPRLPRTGRLGLETRCLSGIKKMKPIPFPNSLRARNAIKTPAIRPMIRNLATNTNNSQPTNPIPPKFAPKSRPYKPHKTPPESIPTPSPSPPTPNHASSAPKAERKPGEFPPGYKSAERKYVFRFSTLIFFYLISFLLGSLLALCLFVSFHSFFLSFFLKG